MRLEASYKLFDDDGNEVQTGMQSFDLNVVENGAHGVVAEIKWNNSSDTVDHIGTRPRKHG